MAILGTLTKENNDYKFHFNSVYFKIDELFIDTLIEEIRIGIRGYTSEYARQNKGMGIYKKVFRIKFQDLNITNLVSKDETIAACYTYLKTLDEFKTTSDI